MNLDVLIRFYEELSVDSVARFSDFYAGDAWFKDPFNEVRGLPAIQRIFSHIYTVRSMSRGLPHGDD
jgi:steroid delta-isomerase